MGKRKWKAARGEGRCESDTPFEELPDEVQRRVVEARGWEPSGGRWSSVEFVDRPNGRLFTVTRFQEDADETEEIRVAEIRYVERRDAVHSRSARVPHDPAPATGSTAPPGGESAQASFPGGAE